MSNAADVSLWTFYVLIKLKKVNTLLRVPYRESSFFPAVAPNTRNEIVVFILGIVTCSGFFPARPSPRRVVYL